MASKKYLDLTGLSQLWAKIKAKLDNKADKDHTHLYAGSTTAGGAATKAVASEQDGNGNVIASTYATKTELTETVDNIDFTYQTEDGKRYIYLDKSGVMTTADAPVSRDDEVTIYGINFSDGTKGLFASLYTEWEDLQNRPTAISFAGAVTATTKRLVAGVNPIDVTSLDGSYLNLGTQNKETALGTTELLSLTECYTNRFAFMSPNDIAVEYSTDGGTTWLDYGATSEQKTNLVTQTNDFAEFKIGKDTTVTTNSKVRITLTATSLYTQLEKILVYLSRDGASGCRCTIEGATLATPTTYTTLVNSVAVSGWSGWNVIVFNKVFGGYGSTDTSKYKRLRFTFSISGVSSSYNNQLNIKKIYGLGSDCWSSPSVLAQKGTPYSIITDKSATFIGDVKTASGNSIDTIASNIGLAESEADMIPS